MTSQRLPFSPRSVVMAAILWLMVGAVVGGYQQSRSTARHSAQIALTAEICAHLQTVPTGGRYPDSLTNLALIFPDGGDASLLQFFSYSSSGTSCTLRAHLPRGELNRSFP